MEICWKQWNKSRKNTSHTGNIEHDHTKEETTNALKKRADLLPRRPWLLNYMIRTDVLMLFVFKCPPEPHVMFPNWKVWKWKQKCCEDYGHCQDYWEQKYPVYQRPSLISLDSDGHMWGFFLIGYQVQLIGILMVMLYESFQWFWGLSRVSVVWIRQL